MQYSEFTLAGDDVWSIPVHCWSGAERAKGVVQVSHGMGEHPGRYAPLAADLVHAGYLVYANTHRGHGCEAQSSDTLGEFGPGGFPSLVADMRRLTEEIARRHPGLPIFLLGHSMGSFAAQLYIRRHSAAIAGLVLSGTAAPDLRYARLDADGEIGSYRLSDFNAAFEPARTSFDWLSRDPAQVDAYVDDPLCGHTASPRSLRSMRAAFERDNDLRDLADIRPDLPIFLFTGDHDPVNNNLAWFHPLVERYRQAGVREVSFHVYGGARHETLNETNREEVVRNLIAWLDHAPRQSAD